ncbi:MAG: RND transporter [Acidobacteria bacterium]|nr:MAG: RND transporter [Acidobacteriota bacterium]
MWIVRLALRRPYTFVVLALLIAVLGIVSVASMPIDIFPAINIPVVNVIWNYSGLSPTEMQDRIVTTSERAFTTTVTGIEHIESVSLRGVAVTRLFFHPNVPIEAAIAQINAQAQQIVRALPPGIFPPLIIQYNAASVPVVLASLSSDVLPEQQLNDLGNNFIRTQLVTVPGAAVPLPYGGKVRVVNVDIDPDALYARGLSPQDVSNAILTQNVILPAGTAKIGTREYDVATNSSPEVLNDLNKIPIRYVNGSLLSVGDVAFVHDGFNPQTNLVRRDGRHSALLPILSNGSASTLSVVSGARQLMPKILAGLPSSLKVDFLFDQSLFVRAAITGVVREGAIAASLTALMILLFLGSWRSTLIVITSIPLSILTSIIMLEILHQSLNVMTLGGMALAVGILVDDATVEIENNHRQLELGKPLRQAILDGAAEVATPAFVATLSICIVFIPILFLGGVGGALFAPLAMSVVFAMLASYFLSRTLVPTMVLYLLAPEARARESREAGHDTAKRRSLFGRISDGFEAGFRNLTARYEGVLDWALAHTRTVIAVFLAFAAVSLFLYPFVGRDFFPTVDAGQLRLHVRAPAGTRIEETERYFQEVEDYIRRVIPAGEVAAIIDNIGVPNSINLALSDSVTVGPADGEILVSLKTPHGPTAAYLKRLRDELPKRFPDLEFFAQPADIVSQILNFGLPAPIDIQVTGPLADSDKNYEVATQIAAELRGVPGAVDVHVQQILDAPRIMIDTDRALAQQVGLTQRDVASSLLISLTGSGATTTNFWLNYRNGVSYQVVVQTPQHRVASLDALHRTPVAIAGQATPQLLGNLADFRRTVTPLSLNHYNVQPVFDVYAGVQGRDLGSVASDISGIIAKHQRQLSKASSIVVRGQVLSMNQSFLALALGIAFAVLFVYFLMVVNFQSWLDPLIILMALPGALAGILWALFVTGTTISVPALMGCIMAIGVATSNSILMITFANEQRHPEFGAHEAREAALLAGRTRLRPVLMTALAMLIGMLPMSLGLGEGGEQNAPLGRAVIGGLMVATFYTLFFVPVTYSVLRRKPPKDFDAEDQR